MAKVTLRQLSKLSALRPARQVIASRVRQAIISKDCANVACKDVEHATVHTALLLLAGEACPHTSLELALGLAPLKVGRCKELHHEVDERQATSASNAFHSDDRAMVGQKHSSRPNRVKRSLFLSWLTGATTTAFAGRPPVVVTSRHPFQACCASATAPPL